LKKYILILLIIFFNLKADGEIDLWGVDLDSSSNQELKSELIESDETNINMDTNINIQEEQTQQVQRESIKVKFEEDYDIAQRKAIEEDKYIFLLVTEKNCPWCERLKNKVLVTPKVAERLQNEFIPIEVDRVDGYYPSIGITGTPSIFILNPEDNKTVERVSGYRDSNYLLNLFNRVKK